MSCFVNFLCLVTAQAYINKGWMLEAQLWEDGYLERHGLGYDIY